METRPLVATAHSPASSRAVITAPGSLAWEPCPRPEAQPGMIVVRTVATLLSPGTELAFWLGTHAGLDDPSMPWAKLPFRPGYAAVGTVAEVARGSAFRVGDLVMHTGGHAPWAQVADRHAIRVPAGLAPHRALFARLAQIGATAVMAARSIPVRCAVIGAGPVGIMAAQQLVRAGAARLVVQDLSAPRLERATACGLTCAGGDLAAALGGAPQLIVDATGSAEVAASALAQVAPGGEVVLLGSPRKPAAIDLYRHIHLKHASLTGAHDSMLPMDPPPGARGRMEVLADAVSAIADGTIRTDPLLSHRITPDRLAEAYRGCAEQRESWHGVVIEWSSP